MSAATVTETAQGGSRRLVSPVAFKKEGDTAEVLAKSENGHGPINNSRSDVFTSCTASTISMPRIDSCILGKETLEQREKYTVSNTADILILYSLLPYSPDAPISGHFD